MTAIEFEYKLIDLQGTMMRFAYRLTANKEDAQDLVQETFLKALRCYKQFIYQSNLKAWVFTIMKNTFINNYRHGIRLNIYRDQTKINQLKSTSLDDPDSAYSALEITQNIEQLKDILRIPFKMHINGYKYKEIAEELHLNIGTVKSRIFLSRKRLMDQLSV
ncbi:MAG: RNA polymerase sigma factor [Bacteroidota bacterium]|nr:RNA polymerase sigma factor [Bacteroidota bacterium]